MSFEPQDAADGNIFVEISSTFEDLFGTEPSYALGTTNSYPLIPAAQEMFPHRLENATTASLGLSITHTNKILVTINYEIIGTVCETVSSLSHDSSGGNNHWVISKSMLSDCSLRLFNPSALFPVENPLVQNETHITLQMIDVWISTHPLSCIVSKTLFLRSIMDNDHDHGLLSIILSDAFRFSIVNRSQEKAEKLFYWSVACLKTVFYSTAKISTAQALILVGWHELHQNRPKQAICYFTIASKVIRILWGRITNGIGTCATQINGVSESEVERELLVNLQRITSALRLWMLLQIDHSLIDFEEAKSFAIPVIFNETGSKLVELDIASGNISTLNAQMRSLHNLLSLSQTTFTASLLLAVYNQHENIFPSTGANYGWASLNAIQLDSNRALMESFTARSRATIESVSKASCTDSRDSIFGAESDLMFSIFELAIFFPHFKKQSFTERPIDRRKADDLLGILKFVLQKLRIAPYSGTTHQFSTELVTLVSDVSARVLQHLVSFYSSDQDEVPPRPAKHEELNRICVMLLDLLRSDCLPLSERRIWAAKKLLKRSQVCLESQQKFNPSQYDLRMSSSSAPSSLWPATAPYYTLNTLQITPSLVPYNLSSASDNGYLHQQNDHCVSIRHNLFHTAVHYEPVATAALELQLTTDKIPLLDGHISATLLRKNHRICLS
ncbi:hypothetical protein ABW20_dc0103152 [Dactylellina cionopaga]|nr:hypothetical protein ABW20_dc0103152 [Dactylellina cionopaga]